GKPLLPRAELVFLGHQRRTGIRRFGGRLQVLGVDRPDNGFLGRRSEDIAAIDGERDQRDDHENDRQVKRGLGLSVHGFCLRIFEPSSIRESAACHSFSAGIASTRMRFSYNSTRRAWSCAPSAASTTEPFTSFRNANCRADVSNATKWISTSPLVCEKSCRA